MLIHDAHILYGFFHYSCPLVILCCFIHDLSILVDVVVIHAAERMLIVYYIGHVVIVL